MNTVLIVSKDKDEFFDLIVQNVTHMGIEIVDDPDLADFTIVLGGDGTVLGAARSGITSPVLVINTGHLGFLTSSDRDNAVQSIDRVMQGEFSVTERHLLHVSTVQDTEPVEYFGLNDVVIRPRASSDRNLSKLIHLSVFGTDEDTGVEQHIADYRADGLIVSTPTGSTAYSLSANGPIIHPSCRSFVVTPICPQGLTHRPLVLPYSTKLRIEPHDSDLYLSIDGQIGQPIEQGPSVLVAFNCRSIMTINPLDSYFAVLQKKLGWAIRPQR